MRSSFLMVSLCSMISMMAAGGMGCGTEPEDGAADIAAESNDPAAEKVVYTALHEAFEYPNYAGEGLVFRNVNSWYYDNLHSWGWGSRISSIKVLYGTCQYYTGINWSGYSATISQNYPQLGWLDESIASVWCY